MSAAERKDARKDEGGNGGAKIPPAKERSNKRRKVGGSKGGWAEERTGAKEIAKEVHQDGRN